MGDATAGRTLMIGLPGPELDPRSAERVERLAPAGVILFGRNLVDPEQTARLLEAVTARIPRPCLIAIDQEGGRVSRLAPWVGPTPTARELAAAGPAAARAFGAATGQALRALGINVDFAPVVDLSEVDAPNGIGDRAFGTDPEDVTRLAGAFLDGLQATGVAGCLKHFPGLGPTCVDSHVALPRIELDAASLAPHMLPFRRLAARAASVMVGHGDYPAFDTATGRPASLSAAIVTGLLRERLAYAGLVVSDDLEMGAVAALDVAGCAAVQALTAGCDLLLYCSDLDRAECAAAALAARATREAAFAARLAAAAAAVARTASRFTAAPGDPAAWAVARAGLRRSGAQPDDPDQSRA